MRFLTIVFSLATLAAVGCKSEEQTTIPLPAATTEVVFNTGDNPTIKFTSEGLHCEVCDANACKTLANVPGVVDVLADHNTNTITVAIDEATFENDAALEALHGNGLFEDAAVVGDEVPAAEEGDDVDES